MNEAVIRSPKWLRNFADFEINTGEDIKGEPSQKRKKQMEEELLQREEEERLKREEEEKARLKEKEKQFNILFRVIMIYIQQNYIKCHITIDKNDELTIESKDDLQFKNKNLKFKVTLIESVLPKFEVEIVYDSENFIYTTSGYGYNPFKNFIINIIYPYYRLYGNKRSNGKQSTNSNNYETEESKNKKRRYELLKQTLEGYKRELSRLRKEGAKQSDIQIVLNQIENIKDKINNMNKEFQFESLYYLKHLKFFEEV